MEENGEGWIWKDGECVERTTTGVDCPDGFIYDKTSLTCKPRSECGFGEYLDEDTNTCKEVDDIDGDGKKNDEDRDIDGDGYYDKDEDLNPVADDVDPKHYNVGDRDLLMFITMSYEPVDSNLDRIAGDTMTGNGNTVEQNYLADLAEKGEESAFGEDGTMPDGDGNGFFDVEGEGYFNYVCPDRSSWNVAEEGKNRCLVDEERMIGMQAQDYNGIGDDLFKAWQVIGGEFYFGNDEGAVRNGADENDNSYGHISEVNQWVIIDHVSDPTVSLFKRHSNMEATLFRLNNNYVLAYRGTDFPDLIEWMVNFGTIPDGMKAYEARVKEYAKNTFGKIAEEYTKDPDSYIAKYGGEPNFYITGHSLGGYLAQIGALGLIENSNEEDPANPINYLRSVVYFNGMGLGHHPLQDKQDREFNLLFDWAQKTDKNGAQHKVMCYSIKGDMIAALGRHVNQTTYYASEGAVLRHATQNVSKLQNEARSKLVSMIVSTIFTSLGKTLGDQGVWYNRLDETSDYLKYYTKVYGNNFGWSFDENNIISSTGILDLFWFTHEPSASLLYNISQGYRGYSETVKINPQIVNNKVTLTAEVNGNSSASSYVWYKDGSIVSEGSNEYSFENNSGSEGTYKVSAIVKSREANGEVREKTVEGEHSFDKVGPTVTISTVGDVWNLRSGETISYIVRAYDKSGFVGDGADATLSIGDIKTTGIASNSLSINEDPVLDTEQSDDYTRVYKVNIKSSSAGYLTLKINEGAFSDGNGNRSKETKANKSVHFTIFEYKQEDKTKPTITITPDGKDSAQKGESLRFKIQAFDEGGIKSDDLGKIDYSCTLGGETKEFDGKVNYSEDKKIATAYITVKCDDSNRLLASFGTLTVGSGAFSDENGNKSPLKVHGAIKFSVAPDKTGPYITITPDNGYQAKYGETLGFTLTVSDDSGIVDAPEGENLFMMCEGVDMSEWYGEIADLGLLAKCINNSIGDVGLINYGKYVFLDSRSGLDWSNNVSGPFYNENKTTASYHFDVESDPSSCSKYHGCSGTVFFVSGVFKDSFGNTSKAMMSGEIKFAPAEDTKAPNVSVTALDTRSVEIGEGIDFKIVATDEGGIDKETGVLNASMLFVDGVNKDAVITNISEPNYNEDGTRVEYIVTLVGNSVSSSTKLVVKSGSFYDMSGNPNKNTYSDIVMFTRKLDLIPPTVTITPLVGWNAIRGEELKLRVQAVDNGGISKNKSVSEKDFFIAKLISNDTNIVSVKKEEDRETFERVSYIVTLKALKTGKALLNVKTGTFKDSDGNASILKVSNTITFEAMKDSTPPSVSITKVSNTSVKKDDKITLRLTVTDAGGLISPTLTKEALTVSGNKDIKVTGVREISNRENEATWEITVEQTGGFGFGQLVKDALIILPKGYFKDGANLSSNRATSPLVKFTKY